MEKNDVLNLTAVDRSMLAMLTCGGQADLDVIIESYIKAKKKVDETIVRMMNE